MLDKKMHQWCYRDIVELLEIWYLVNMERNRERTDFHRFRIIVNYCTAFTWYYRYLMIDTSSICL